MLLLLQQSPPSKLQFELLFSSSQYVSLTHCGLPQPDGVGVEVFVVVFVAFVVVVVVVVDTESKQSHFCKCYKRLLTKDY